MSGKQTLPPYLLPAPYSPPPGKPFKEKLLDFLEPYFTGDYRKGLFSSLFKTAFYSTLIGFGVVTFFKCFHLRYGFLLPPFGTPEQWIKAQHWPEWYYDRVEPFSTFWYNFTQFWRAVWRDAGYVAPFVIICVTLRLPGAVWHYVPKSFLDRKYERESLAAEKERLERTRQDQLARQQREANEKAARDAEENQRRAVEEAAAQAVERETQQDRAKEYIEGRKFVLAELEKTINVEIARAKQELLIEANPPAEGAYGIVRRRLQGTTLHPSYGLLHESRDAGVKLVIGNSPNWLPPLPPYPPGVAPTLLT